MKELKVGMYCFCKQRRNLGIGKILNVSELANVAVQFKNHAEVFVSKNLVASENIIDLIQLGDYVNGTKVTDTMIKMRDEQGIFGIPDHYKMFIDEIHIESVVTKEQFNSVKYEVE